MCILYTKGVHHFYICFLPIESSHLTKYKLHSHTHTQRGRKNTREHPHITIEGNKSTSVITLSYAYAYSLLLLLLWVTLSSLITHFHIEWLCEYDDILFDSRECRPYYCLLQLVSSICEMWILCKRFKFPYNKTRWHTLPSIHLWDVVWYCQKIKFRWQKLPDIYFLYAAVFISSIQSDINPPRYPDSQDPLDFISYNICVRIRWKERNKCSQESHKVPCYGKCCVRLYMYLIIIICQFYDWLLQNIWTKDEYGLYIRK